MGAIKNFLLGLDDTEKFELPFDDISTALVNFQINDPRGTSDYKLIPVYRGVQLISDIVAEIPLRQVTKKTGDFDPESPRLLERPDRFLTSSSVKRQIVASLIFSGSAYLMVREYDRFGFPSDIFIADPALVTVQWNTNRSQRFYYYLGEPVEAFREIYPIHLNLFPGALEGIGPLYAGAVSLQAAKAQELFHRNLWVNNGVPMGLLTVKGKMDDSVSKEIRKRWQAAYAGANQGEVAVLGNGTEFQQLTLSPESGEVLASRRYAAIQVATLLGLDAWWLNEQSGGSKTYVNVRDLLNTLIETLIAPTYLTPIQETFSEMLPSTKICRADVSALVEPDGEVAARIASSLVASGIWSQEQANAFLPKSSAPGAS